MRYWKIRAGKAGYLWDAWKREGIITVGWDVGDVRDQEWDKTRELVDDKYESSPGYVAGVLHRFVGILEDEEMEEGDVAVVLGSGTVLDLCEIGEYRYKKGGLKEAKSHAYWRDVKYYDIGPVRIRDLPDKFQQGGGETSLHLPSTLNEYYVDQDTIDELIEAMQSVEPVELSEGLIDFSEDSIQQYIAGNFKDIDDSIVSLEREYSTRVGDADFFGEDKNGDLVVIEVKTGTAQDNVVGQLLGYMNAIRANEKRKVRGIIVAEDFTERVREAVKSDDIFLFSFKTKLEFTER